MKPPRLVTVATYSTTLEAQAAQAMLEASGVRTFLESAEFVAAVWHMGAAVGNVRLQVAEVDAAAARELLAEPVIASHAEGAETTEATAVRCGDCGLVYDIELTECPACGWTTGDDPAAEHDRRAGRNIATASSTHHETGDPNALHSLRTIRSRYRWLIWLWLIPTLLGFASELLVMVLLISRGVSPLAGTAVLVVLGGAPLVMIAALLRHSSRSTDPR